MRKQAFQHAEIRDENDNIVNNGAYGKNTALSNAQNDGWIDHVMNNLEYLYEHGTGGSNSNIAIINADATIKIGGTTTLAPTERARVTNRGTDRQAVLYFEIPQGKQGKDGKQGEKGEKGEKGDPTSTVTLGKVTTVAPTEQARAVNVGTKNDLILDLYIPQGKQGTLDGIDLTKYVVHDELKDLAKKESLVGLASTEYVDGRIKHVVGTAPEALDTLGEIATVLTKNKDKIGTIVNEISTKADKGTVENALMGKATKEELATKADKTAVYSKTESDGRYQSKGSYLSSSDIYDAGSIKLPSGAKIGVE